MSLTGSGVEQIEVVAVHNVLGLRAGDRTFVPVDTPELTECLQLGFVHQIVDGEELAPEVAVLSQPRPCCGG